MQPANKSVSNNERLWEVSLPMIRKWYDIAKASLPQSEFEELKKNLAFKPAGINFFVGESYAMRLFGLPRIVRELIDNKTPRINPHFMHTLLELKQCDRYSYTKVYIDHEQANILSRCFPAARYNQEPHQPAQASAAASASAS